MTEEGTVSLKKKDFRRLANVLTGNHQIIDALRDTWVVPCKTQVRLWAGYFFRGLPNSWLAFRTRRYESRRHDITDLLYES